MLRRIWLLGILPCLSLRQFQFCFLSNFTRHLTILILILGILLAMAFPWISIWSGVTSDSMSFVMVSIMVLQHSEAFFFGARQQLYG